LFDDEVDAQLKKLVDAIFEKQRIERKFGRQQLSDSELGELSDKADQVWETVIQIMKKMPEIFAKYLKLPR
jgi:ATP-dependent helicase/DNAse subunit B